MIIRRKIVTKCLPLLLCFSMLSLTSCGLLDEEWDEYDEVEEYDNEEPSNDEAKAKEQEQEATVVDLSDVDISKYFSDGAVREPQVKLKGNGADKVTILIYMNGSNLESEDSEATTDLSEIIAAGNSDKVNILVQTMGTKKWDKKYEIASDHSQIYKIEGNGLTLLRDDLGQVDCTTEKALSDFIVWGAQNYPADRYILHFWDHGGGPVYGFGYDEWNDDDNASLTIDEMQRALKTAGVYFDFVGMDCCLMSCLEVCCAFYDYCDYMVLSEDFESGLGWAYTNWVRALYKNTSIPTTDLGKMICDDMVKANETEEGGDKSSMSLIDEGKLKVLYAAWKDFAYANESNLLGTNYSRSVKRAPGGRIHPRIKAKHREKGWFSDWNYFFFGDDEENATMAEYFVTDIMEVASAVDSEQSKTLSAALKEVLLYVKNTETDAGLTGIAVSLPYGDNDYYNSMKPIFTNVGLDQEYVGWLSKFVSVSNPSAESEHEDWDEEWDGWDDYDDDYDWGSWGYSEYDDGYWNDDCGFNDWSYNDSWNEWSDENDWIAPQDWDDDSDEYDSYDDYCGDCYGDNWYYEDNDYWGDDFWFFGDWF